MKTIRFWVYWRNGYVRLTLKIGQTLTVGYYAHTDDGYHYESSTWGYDGEQLMEHWINGGRDCDGPIEQSGSLVCKLSEIQAVDSGIAGLSRPNWQEHSPTRVRDAYAEAMNY